MPIFEEAIKYVQSFGDDDGYSIHLQLADADFVTCTFSLKNYKVCSFKSRLLDIMYFMQHEENEFEKNLIPFYSTGEVRMSESDLEMLRVALQTKVKQVFHFYSMQIGQKFEY
jgi:hypothetical protein